MPRADSGSWFAWYPVRLGALGTAGVAWLRYVRYCTSYGLTIYHDEDHVYWPNVRDSQMCSSVQRHRDRVAFFEMNGFDFQKWYQWKLSSGEMF